MSANTGSCCDTNIANQTNPPDESFNSITAVNATITNLTTGTVSPISITTATLNGNPGLTISTGVSPVVRLNLPSTGIAADNTATNILALSPGDGVTVVYKNNVADTSSAQTFTNKTIDSASNTITITSSPLAAANINTILNQAVTTTATPTFGLTTITYSSTNSCGLQVNNTNAAGTAGGMMCLNNGLQCFEIGVNNSTNEAYLFNRQNTAMKFATNFVERLRIDGAGITNDNTITSILGLNGTSLRTKTNVADTSTAQTFTNKTLDSAANTITITSSPLAAANINTILNQAVTTTSTPTFGLTTITYSSTNACGLQVNNTNAAGTAGGMMCLNNGVQCFEIGTNNSTNEAYLFNRQNTAMKFGTNFVERLRIDGAGITNDNTITNILGLSGTSLRTKTNVADTSTAQTFTNKTLDSAANTITITSGGLSGANVNTVLNQALLTTSTPTFGITTISYATSAAGLVIDNTNTGVSTSGVVCRVNGTSTLNLGVNASTSEPYLYTLTSTPLKFGTNGTERLRISSVGLITTSNCNSITQGITVNNSYALGSKADYAYSSAGGAFFSSAVTGDINIRNTDTAVNLNLGVGSGTAQIKIANTLITTNVTLRPNVAADETAANYAAINASGNLVTCARASGQFTSVWTTSAGFGTPASTLINYGRVGNVVICSALFSGTSCAVGVNTATFTLPITPATFVNGADCSGTVVAVHTALGVDIQGAVSAINLITSATIQVRNDSVGSVTVDLYCSFTYKLS